MARILIAEDDSAIRKAVGTILERMGHTVLLSQNGEHAFESLQVDPNIELLITDMMMPKVTGEELIMLMKGNHRLEALPVILISAMAEIMNIDHLRRAGVLRIQAKPLSITELKENIDLCLRQRTGADEPVSITCQRLTDNLSC